MGKINLADELLVGSIDMHCHAYPEFSNEFPNRYTTAEHIQKMVDAGMDGVVLKSHFWPVLQLTAELQRQFPNFNIIGSITLNDGVGGMSPWAVETAARLGAKVVWLYTWTSANDIAKGGISKTIANYIPSLNNYIFNGGKTLFDENGKICRNMLSILELCKQYDLVICTGHISVPESLALAEEAKKIGFKKLIFTHPDSGSVGATDDQIVRFAELGGFIELCALGLTPIHHRITPQRFGKIVHSVGAGRCIASTDYFFEWDSPSPELLRSLISALLYVDISSDEIKQITSYGPKELLGIN